MTASKQGHYKQWLRNSQGGQGTDLLKGRAHTHKHRSSDTQAPQQRQFGAAGGRRRRLSGTRQQAIQRSQHATFGTKCWTLVHFSCRPLPRAPAGKCETTKGRAS